MQATLASETNHVVPVTDPCELTKPSAYSERESACIVSTVVSGSPAGHRMGPIPDPAIGVVIPCEQPDSGDTEPGVTSLAFSIPAHSGRGIWARVTPIAIHETPS